VRHFADHFPRWSGPTHLIWLLYGQTARKGYSCVESGPLGGRLSDCSLANLKRDYQRIRELQLPSSRHVVLLRLNVRIASG